MSVKEMTYTEEQVKGFVSQADCAILVLRKDLGETNQDVTHITGDAENIFDLVTDLIGHISQQGNISKEALLAKIAVGVLIGDEESIKEK